MKPKYRNATLRGTAAAKEGKPRTANPYGWDAPEMARCWDEGWHAASKKAVTFDDGFDLDDPDFAEYMAY